MMIETEEGEVDNAVNKVEWENTIKSQGKIRYK